MINLRGERTGAEPILRSISLMHERSNGMGGGFAAYGIYPEHADDFAFHVMYYSNRAREESEVLIDKSFEVVLDERLPTRQVEGVTDPPVLWRYFLRPRPLLLAESASPSEEDFVLAQVMKINADIDGAYVFSCGKNMGAFKAVGYAEDVGRFYRLDEYLAYCWVAHARYPTNTPGWWAGAHPFTMLDWSVVHNGEISSYGINRRYLEMFGYRCTMLTDTEVMAYLLDLLIRRHELPIEVAAKILSAPFWKTIERLPDEEKVFYKQLRQIYSSALVNGPFAIVFAWSGGMVGLNDRIKLRPLVAARAGENLYLSSEESGIRAMCDDPEVVWSPKAGEPVIGRIGESVVNGQPRKQAAAM
jgi:glutamate synthase domain-containing protein 1